MPTKLNETPKIGAMLRSIIKDDNGNDSYWLVAGKDERFLQIKLVGDGFKTSFSIHAYINSFPMWQEVK